MATITTGANTINVELQNLLADPLAVDQVITGISFNLSFHDTNAISLSSVTGQLIETPIKGGALQNDSTDSIDHWGVSSSNPTSGTTAINLSAFTGSGPPTDGIIGGPGSNGLYNNVNSSITNGHAAPFILSSGDFSLFLPGVAASTTVNSVMFTLGTANTDVVTTHAFTVAPEPGSWWMFLSGGVFLGAGAWRRGRNKISR